MVFDYVIVGIITLIIIILIYREFGNVPMYDPHTGGLYNVYRNYEDPYEAMKTMYQLESTLMKLMEHLQQKYPHDPVVIAILERYNPDGLGEVKPNNIFGRTSFTVDKGITTKFCIRDRTTHQIHDIQILKFVAIHELAHMGDWNYGHTHSFWQVFKFLLIEASSAGILNSPQYRQEPVKYCGMRVNYNPLYDTNLQQYRPISSRTR